MNQEQRQAYEWAKNQDYQSVAARYAKILAGLVDEIATPNEPLTLEQAKRERDAAVADLEHLMLVFNSGECCMMCKHDHEHLTGPCAGTSTRCEPEWRGLKKED